jgi:hypothetical protein
MQNKEWFVELFASIDARNIEKFVSFLDADCDFRFGNLPAVTGIDSISDFVGGFFASVASLRHDLNEFWLMPDGAVCHGTVSYTRHDGSVLSVPFANIFKTRNLKIVEYLIFADTSQLYQQQ